MAKTVDDKVVQGIRQRAAATLVKAAGTGSLQGAFTTLNNRQRIALDLQKAVENGTLEAAITKVFEDKKKASAPSNEKPEGGSQEKLKQTPADEELARIKAKCKASLEAMFTADL